MSSSSQHDSLSSRQQARRWLLTISTLTRCKFTKDINILPTDSSEGKFSAYYLLNVSIEIVLHCKVELPLSLKCHCH